VPKVGQESRLSISVGIKYKMQAYLIGQLINTLSYLVTWLLS